MGAQKIGISNPDGTTTSVHRYGDGPGPVIFIFPAMGVKAATYAPLAEALAGAGYIAVTADLRGRGESSVRPGKGSDFGYRDLIDQDLHSIVTDLAGRYPDRKRYLLGHSLGGQLSCLYASRGLTSVDGLILIACCSVYYGGWEGMAKYRIWLGTQLIGLIARVAGYYPGRRVGFGGTNAKTMMLDWSRQARTGRYELSGDKFNYEAALAALDLTVLAISFEGDDLAPPKAVHHLTDKFSADAPVTHIHLGKADPLNLRYNHFNWPKRPESIVRMIGEWMGG